MKINRILAAVSSACVRVRPATSWAQVEDAWHGDVIHYGFPSIGGSTAFPNADSPIGVDSSDVIGSLEGAFMGSLQVSKDPWGIWNDLMYVDASSSKTGSRDLSIGRVQIPANVSVDRGPIPSTCARHEA